MTPDRIDRHPAPAELDRIPRYTSPPPPPDIEYERGSLPLTHYIWILKRSKWKILSFVAACMLITLFVCLRLTPIYESTARVDIDRRAPSGILGQEGAENNNANTNDADQFLTTQIELVQSDGVLRPVAEKFHLLEHEKQLEDLSPEKALRVKDAPIKLKKLKVVRPPNSFILRISYRSPDARLASDVTNAIAESYLEHTYYTRVKTTLNLSNFMERQIDELKAKMEESSRALAVYERELNVINPEEKTNILSARLLQLNTQYTTAQADRVEKEAAHTALQDGSLSAVQVSKQADALAKLQEKVEESQERLAELKATYGPNYSEYKRAASQLAELQRQYEDNKSQITSRIDQDYTQAANREQMLKKAVAQTKAEYDQLNLRSFQYQQLKREADSDKKLYDEMITKIKEAGINAGFQNSTIRIADEARPGWKPVFPQIPLMLVLSFLLSSILGIGAAVMVDLTDNAIKDPEQATRMLQVDVIGTLPAVKKSDFLMLNTPALPGEGAPISLKLDAKARENSYKNAASYEEAIRTLRNQILLGDFDRRLRSILVTSATPGEGKSTTILHLAIAHAEQGKKTLLIDADLRRPSIHRRFKLSNTIGLSTTLTGVLPWREVVVKTESFPNLDIIPSGPSSRRASDVIGPMMVDLLDEAAKDYDLILVDAPPLLGFAEPLQLASATDGVIVVTQAGETNRKAVATRARNP